MVAILDIRISILAILNLHAAPITSTPSDTAREQIIIKDFQDGPHGSHHGNNSDGDVENV